MPRKTEYTDSSIPKSAYQDSNNWVCTSIIYSIKDILINSDNRWKLNHRNQQKEQRKYNNTKDIWCLMRDIKIPLYILSYNS